MIKTTNPIYYENIADAIREKTGSTDKYYPAEMADAIEAIPSGGGGESGSLLSRLDNLNDTTLLEMPFGSIKMPDRIWSEAAWAHGFLYKYVSGSGNVAILPDFNAADEFRIGIKFKFNIYSSASNQDNALLGTSSETEHSPIPEILFNYYDGYIFADLVDENQQHISLTDVGTGDSQDFNGWVYAVLSANGTEIRLYLYDKDGEVIDYKAATGFKIIANTTANRTGVAIGGTQEDPSVIGIDALIDLAECFIEADGVMIWGVLNDITETLGIFTPNS